MKRHFTALLTIALTVTATTAAHAQSTGDDQWRAAPTATLSTLLQNGYKIVSVIANPQTNADIFFLQRDQSAFKCADPQQPTGKAKQTPACFELVSPDSPAPESK